MVKNVENRVILQANISRTTKNMVNLFTYYESSTFLLRKNYINYFRFGHPFTTKMNVKDLSSFEVKMRLYWKSSEQIFLIFGIKFLTGRISGMFFSKFYKTNYFCWKCQKLQQKVLLWNYLENLT